MKVSMVYAARSGSILSRLRLGRIRVRKDQALKPTQASMDPTGSRVRVRVRCFVGVRVRAAGTSMVSSEGGSDVSAVLHYTIWNGLRVHLQAVRISPIIL